MLHPRYTMSEACVADVSNGQSELDTPVSVDSSEFRPENTQLVAVLLNDNRSRRIVLHTRLKTQPDKDAIVILQKSPFPVEPDGLCSGKVVKDCVPTDTQSETIAVKNGSGHGDTETGLSTPDSVFPPWETKPVTTNDVYHRMLVTAGLEAVNGVDMTVIFPAEPHHIKRFTASRKRLIHETPEMYRSITVPFLAKTPRDLSWVDNVLSGAAEQDRVLMSDSDEHSGFVVALDYRWDERNIEELHCLGLVRDKSLTCLRDLTAEHVPMLQRILAEGRTSLVNKYGSNNQLTEDQIVAYIHYPPTFYRFHVHFGHIMSGEDESVRIGRAHLLEHVIQNLQLCSGFYHDRVISMFMYDLSPMLKALLSPPTESTDHSSTEAKANEISPPDNISTVSSTQV